MHLVLSSNIKCPIPLVQLNIHLNGSVVELGLNVDALRLRVLLEVDGECSILGDITGHGDDLTDELDLISSLDGSQSDLSSSELTELQRQARQASPKRSLLHESA